jgi:hypothetical protein
MVITTGWNAARMVIGIIGAAAGRVVVPDATGTVIVTSAG